jgi:hypothetical protein
LGKHHQQRVFLAQRRCFALISLLIAAGLSKEPLKGCFEALSLLRARMVSVGEEPSVECPELLGEIHQEVDRNKEAEDQLLVVAILASNTVPTGLSSR